MPNRKIYTWPSAQLRKISKEVVDFEQAKSVAVDLRDTMLANIGIGLAAPQIGIHQRILVVKSDTLPTLPKSKCFDDICVLVNPSIEVLGEEKFKWPEACLSVENTQGDVERHSKVLLTYQNLEEKELSFALENVESGVIQHEADHLDGRLFIDLMPIFERSRIMKRIRKKINEKKKAEKLAQRDHMKKVKRNILRKKRKKRAPKSFGKRKK